MTCASCEETIKHSVNQLPGIVETKADYDSGTANIKYDPSKTDKNSIIKAINATGYKTEGEIKP
jgi:copper chaperone CopZ